VVAIGAIEEIQELDEILMETLNVPVRRQVYYNYFSCSEAVKKILSDSKRLSYFNVIASVLLFDRVKVDLTSEERKLQKKLEARGREMLKTGILVMLLLSLIFAGFMTKFIAKKSYLQNLTARYQPIREDAKKVELLFSKTQGIKDFLTSRGTALETLAELYEATPLEVRLTGIKYEESGKFLVKGTASVKAVIFTFVANLEKSDVFKTVKTKHVTSRSENGQDVADFEINCIIDRKGFTVAA
jgi:Tfp pilus assembly protein PilN